MVDHSIGKDLPSVSVESFECFPGKGLVATLLGAEVLCSAQKIWWLFVLAFQAD